MMDDEAARLRYISLNTRLNPDDMCQMKDSIRNSEGPHCALLYTSKLPSIQALFTFLQTSRLGYIYDVQELPVKTVIGKSSRA